VTKFIASEVAYRDQLITQMQNLVPKNPVLRSLSLGGLLLGGFSLASEVATENIDRRKVVVGAVAMGFATMPVAYRAAQALSRAALSDDRYVGPKWPVLLALGRSNVTLKQLRALIARFKENLQ